MEYLVKFSGLLAGCMLLAWLYLKAKKAKHDASIPLSKKE